ncbi:MAG: DUF2232 domain-containing protein [Halobacteriovoraceae bacterium]|nr:DUF2232 domain-containing protein [Halobacteriovoraceae bacterium]MBT5093092.1 DUF2232 domain-containing protein [Halobacteriovoraceae bacterium]
MNQTVTEFDIKNKSDQERNSYWRLLLFGLLALILGGLPPVSFLAPIPLVFGMLLFGRAQTLVMGTLCLVIYFALTQITSHLPIHTGGVFIISMIYAAAVSEIIYKGLSPVKGLVRAGTVIIAFMGFLLLSFALFSETPIEKLLENEVTQVVEVIKAQPGFKANTSEDALLFKEMFSNPKEIASSIISWSPTFLFVGTFLGLWVCLFFVLRNSFVWRKKVNYPFAKEDLLNFRVPDYMVWILIAALSLMLGGNYLGGTWGEVIGGNVLYCLSIFYFFQGFGIFLDFLTFLKVGGFLRTFFVVFTIFLGGWRVLIVVGIFDLWVNFRKFLVRKNDSENEGDKK